MQPATQFIENTPNTYRPTLLRLSNEADRTLFNSLYAAEGTYIHDEIYGQLTELIKSKHPTLRMTADQYTAAINQHLDGTDLQDYGLWVYYPWSRRLIHLLDQEEFIDVRTNRNQYKITRAERDLLATKKVGIIGLSVGQSIALTMAMERSAGELRLADFDHLELSNLNRIRTGLHHLGLPKVVIAAREIAEIDPFIKVRCFFDGLTQTNMEQFFTQDGQIDILVDECDGLDVKILSRYKARALGIPVIMDTSDRGMLDIERFDLEPDRPILHGMAEGLDPSNIKEISNEDKVPIVLQMLGADNLSVRAKASMVEVAQSINTWPQLASSVTLGGAAGADTCRRILLDQLHVSGRFYVDFEKIIEQKAPQPIMTPANKIDSTTPAQITQNPYQPLQSEKMTALARLITLESDNTIITPTNEQISALVAAACAAPSTGNDQPWKWLYQKGTLYLFQEQHRSFSFGDFQNTASYISLGAAFENLHIHALKMGLTAHLKLADQPLHPLVATVQFSQLTAMDDPKAKALQQQLISLDKVIYNRTTNRNPSTLPVTALSAEICQQLSQSASSIPGATVQFFTDPEQIKALGTVIGICDRVRLLDSHGHFDFVHREMRWTPEQAEITKDGIDIRTLGLNSAQLAALSVIKSEAVIQTLNTLKGGKAIEDLAHQTVATASALCLITLPQSPENNLPAYFEGGRAMERLWLTATQLNLAVHPLISPIYLFTRLNQGHGEGLDPAFLTNLHHAQQSFTTLTGLQKEQTSVFLAKIAFAPEPALKSFRIPLTETLILA